jgi:hypothetical protein
MKRQSPLCSSLIANAESWRETDGYTNIMVNCLPLQQQGFFLWSENNDAEKKDC